MALVWPDRRCLKIIIVIIGGSIRNFSIDSIISIGASEEHKQEEVCEIGKDFSGKLKAAGAGGGEKKGKPEERKREQEQATGQFGRYYVLSHCSLYSLNSIL